MHDYSKENLKTFEFEAVSPTVEERCKVEVEYP